MSGRRARAIRAALARSLGRRPYKATFRGYLKTSGASVFAPQDEARAARRAYTRGRRGFYVYGFQETPGLLARAAQAVARAGHRALGRAA